jgi:hypothetical protein
MRSLPFKASFANRSIARVLVALAVASSLLSTIAPFSTASSNKLCTMACCAGKAPHIAGSCVHESCETPPVRAQVFTTKEHLCGEEQVSRTTPVIKFRRVRKTPSLPLRTQRALPDSSPNSVASFKKPCPPDCGAATCSSPNQRRSRDLLTVALSDHSQSSLDRLRQSPDHQLSFSDAFSRNCPVRGPPTLLT